MIKVLVVEDSPVVREFLVHVLNSDPEIQTIGTANDGEEALEFLRHNKPDVITMDIHMPRMNGLEATRRIMETKPTPIVIVSGSRDPKEVSTTFQALRAGALAVLQRPRGIGHPDYEETAKALVQTVKLMSEVKVVRRWPRSRPEAVAPRVTLKEAGVSKPPAEIQIVTIGASTGGPLVLQTILSGLTRDFPLPVLIVQHMAAGFVDGFVEWLAHSTDLDIHVAAHAQHAAGGHVYVAPDGFQMGVAARSRIALGREGAENGLRPSVSYLFRSVADVYGRHAAAVLLTGMGKDGAKELKLIRQKGGVTIAQDEGSSVVHGMPGEAIRLEAATYVLPPEKIAVALQSLAISRY